MKKMLIYILMMSSCKIAKLNDINIIAFSIGHSY